MGRSFLRIGAVAAVLAGALALAWPAHGQNTLLNVSYDPTRELYQDFNKAFAAHWLEQTGERVTINQSHGGSGKQARAVIDGLEAGVVTLALAYDVDMLCEKAQLLPADWQGRLPNNSCPYTSTIVFLVRKGNPKGIKDWEDLVRADVAVITPNPETSGGARWNYLAAWGYALRRPNGGKAQAQDFVTRLFKNVPVLDTGARGSTTTFVERGMGDVLLAWENEALLAVNTLGQGRFEILLPSVSILAEPPVALIDKVVDKHGSGELPLAQAYLEYLYSEEGQEICARHYYRPTLDAVARKFAAQFPKVTIFTIKDVFGSWAEAQKKHFGDGGVFDGIYQGK